MPHATARVYRHEKASPIYTTQRSKNANVVLENTRVLQTQYRTMPPLPKEQLAVVRVQEKYVRPRPTSRSHVTVYELPPEPKREKFKPSPVLRRKPSITTTTGTTVSSKSSLTSSRTGTLYFAFGPNVPASHLAPKSALKSQKLLQPIALAKLKGWRWIVSSCGMPNIVPLHKLHRHGEADVSSAGEKLYNADVVYGLIYRLSGGEEQILDQQYGCDDAGPVNNSIDPMEVARRPNQQGDNATNKLYQRVGIVEWLGDPLLEGINVVRDAVDVKCMMYVDESLKGLMPGRLQDGQVSKLSKGVTIAVEKYGLPERWVKQVMSQHGVAVIGGGGSRGAQLQSAMKRRDQRRSSGYEKWKPKRGEVDVNIDDELDDGTIIQTRITKVTEGYEPLPRSDLYREKWHRAKRYSS